MCYSQRCGGLIDHRAGGFSIIFTVDSRMFLGDVVGILGWFVGQFFSL